jgi:hypothetical protein
MDHDEVVLLRVLLNQVQVRRAGAILLGELLAAEIGPLVKRLIVVATGHPNRKVLVEN